MRPTLRGGKLSFAAIRAMDELYAALDGTDNRPLTISPAILIQFFKVGPFTYAGLIDFWSIFAIFFWLDGDDDDGDGPGGRLAWRSKRP